MRVKICGITDEEQGRAIAAAGATALGFICVSASPRYITPPRIRQITTQLPDAVDRVGVFANADIDAIATTVDLGHLNAVQLHGQESLTFCQQLRQRLPQVEIIKALRIRQTADLSSTQAYEPVVDALLLDAYHPDQLGGTGQTLDWETLKAFQPNRPWFLAGGLNPDNILTALAQLSPDGIDLSSGVEHTPGNKDLTKVQRLFQQLRQTVARPYLPTEHG
ncbi:MAG: phosphoribosylanthranilate isomerase [Cyanobacteria bacterium P01_A01_bin.105]